MDEMEIFEQEVREGRRFEFGNNWRAFLSNLNEERIVQAEKSLQEMLEFNDLRGKRFLDIGSGSGLFSLAARRLGAIVYSFDYDPESLACTEELRLRYFPDDKNWSIKQGSVLDRKFLSSMGRFNIVYSWGVLHHTGTMWEALENVSLLVEENGSLFIAIYNDQGIKSDVWDKIKKIYCSGVMGKTFVCTLFIPYFYLKAIIASIIRKKNIFSDYRNHRGMAVFHDLLDWLGGFPYEVAKVENIFRFYKAKGFKLSNIATTNGGGNNQFVFIKKR
jgi:2-polyprenyl-6-hydroxyphenyl methylase/3-demethylubiquinone-9 3-methyltransferase